MKCHGANSSFSFPYKEVNCLSDGEAFFERSITSLFLRVHPPLNLTDGLKALLIMDRLCGAL